MTDNDMSEQAKPNPEYQRMVDCGIGWDPFAYMVNAYARIQAGPRITDLLCPKCHRLGEMTFGTEQPDGSYSATCACGHKRFI